MIPTTIIDGKCLTGIIHCQITSNLPPHTRFICLLLFYPIATVFQLYHSDDMMYEMRRRKPKPYTFTDSRNL